MKTPNEICRLDYFTGTIATAYKGVITSLVAKDFCITSSNGSVELKGTIIAMPDGSYEARLIREGTELSRCSIGDGNFLLPVKDEILQRARNLQIDVVQSGRHIGTFLLKKENAAGVYVPALELSKELKDLKVHELMAGLQARPGLMKKAEDLIAQLMSAKKDWARLSEDIHSFSKDLFWSDPAIFEKWYPVFSKWAAKSGLAVTADKTGRAVSNLLALAELVLVNQARCSNNVRLIKTWLDAVAEAGPSLASRFMQAAEVIVRIKSGIPDADTAPFAKSLLISLRHEIKNAPALAERQMVIIGRAVSDGDMRRLDRYSAEKKREILSLLDTLQADISINSSTDIFLAVNESGAILFQNPDMIGSIVDMIETELSTKSGSAIAAAVKCCLGLLARLSEDGRRKALSAAGRLIIKMIELKMYEPVSSIIEATGKYGSGERAQILFSSGIASAIFSSDNVALEGQYKTVLKELYVPPPAASGFSNDTWAEIVDPQHISRLAKYLQIIGIAGAGASDLLIHLLCNIFISGLHIPDDELFQREVTTYLNSRAFSGSFLFNLILLGRLPVYFNEVGAASILRDATTGIDAWSNDAVLYFLRKQIHVNSSNYNVRLVKEIISSWVMNDPRNLKEVVPDDVYRKLNPAQLAEYSASIRSLFKSAGILDGNGVDFEKLLSVSEDELIRQLSATQTTGEVREKIVYICRIFREIIRKYELAGLEISTSDAPQQLVNYSRLLSSLKAQVLAREKSDAIESLYFKRHIAFGIPSVLGTYHEAKFDALAGIFRTCKYMTLLFEKMIANLQAASTEITIEDYRGWMTSLEVMNDLLHFHETKNREIDKTLAILKTNRLHCSQVIDLLRIWRKELVWIVGSITREIHDPLLHLLTIMPVAGVGSLSRLVREDPDYSNKAADVITRDIISSITGLTEMDRFLDVLIRKLQDRLLTEDDLLYLPDSEVMADPTRMFYRLDQMRTDEATRLGPLTGSKAGNLVYLINHNISVPYGAVLPAAPVRVSKQSAAESELLHTLGAAVQSLEEATGQCFGNPSKPLLLSVRSGSYLSMPGIMTTVLYCGMNTEICRVMAARPVNARFAWDSYRRFIEDYSAAVFNAEAGILSSVMKAFMKKNKVRAVDELDAGQLEMLTGLYLETLAEKKLGVPQDVYVQLELSVKAICSSWSNEKAVQYRRAMSISEFWGTAVLLMQMIPCNTSGSGASVFFTRNPVSMVSGVYGETREAATGDDLVGGSLINRPISRLQDIGGARSLEETDPDLFSLHAELAIKIEEAMGGLPQEVEAAYILGPDNIRTMHALQTRRMEYHPGAVLHFEAVCRMDMKRIGRGIGVHGGVLSGIAVLGGSATLVKKMKKKTGVPLILIREYSSTSDVSLLPHVDGIITATGGATSHAAILSQKFGLVAVVGCAEMIMVTNKKNITRAIINERVIKDGDRITIDGSTGNIYAGQCTGSTQTVLLKKKGGS